MAERIGSMMNPISDSLLFDICSLFSSHIKDISKSASFTAQSIIIVS